MSTFRKRALGWLERRLNLSEIFSFITTYGLAYGEIDPRKPLEEAVEDAFKKPLPVYAQWPYVLGIIAFVLFLFQFVTGMLLAFYYQPTPEAAYESVMLIIRDTALGWYIHQMHYWGSHILLALLFFRLVRLYVHGAYKAPRELVWIFGVALLLFAAYAALTGNLLPWDQRAYWSTTRSLELIAELPLVGSLFGLFVGQLEVQGNTLTRFYVLHAMIIPFSMLILFYLHFATVRRIGLSRLAEGRSLEPRPLFPDHLLNLLTILFLLFGAILTLGMLAPATVQDRATAFVTPLGIHPPWYFLPAYGLAELLPSPLSGIVLMLALLLMLVVPIIDRTGVRPARKRPLALLVFAIVFVALFALGYYGYTVRG